MADINGAFFIFADNEVCGHAHVYMSTCQYRIQNTENIHDRGLPKSRYTEYPDLNDAG